MSNFYRAIKTLNDVDEALDHLADNEAYVSTLKTAGLLMPDLQIIRTQEELGELALEDTDAVVLASEAGAARSVKSLCMMYRLKVEWGLPAVVIATGRQVRAAREAMEQDNE